MFTQITKDELDTPENKASLIFLDRQSKRPGTTHPDIFSQLRKISAQIQDGSVVRYGAIDLLINKQTKQILAIGIGTAYALKTGNLIEDALKHEAKTIQVWSDNTTLNIGEEIAPDWIFGRWHKDEPVWIELGNS